MIPNDALAVSGATLVPVLDAHRFDETALARYLCEHADGFTEQLHVRQFQGGQSNPTFLLESGGRRFVLRKKPPGQLLPSAHLVEREHRVQRALQDTAVPVPRQILLCEDAAIIGTTFYVMEFVEGRIYQQIAGIGSAEQTAQHCAALTATLATLHGVDWRAAGLADFGRADGYLRRQLERWSRQYRASVVGDPDPVTDRLIAWLQANLPATSRTALTHGDYRFGNVVFATGEPRIAALLDWELATLGDPMADLAYLCIPYHLPPDLPSVVGLQGLDLVAMGVPAEATLLTDYCSQCGLDGLAHWPFYQAFAFFRLGAIVQGVYVRALQGNASSSNALAFERLATLYLRTAWRLTGAGRSTE